nr:C2 family cysteine protease [uncultured Lichenicoccus sp.]
MTKLNTLLDKPDPASLFAPAAALPDPDIFDTGSAIQPPVVKMVVPTPTLYLTETGTSTPISVADINQGQLGDCYLLSSIGEIAILKPSFISGMIHLNSNGTEAVTLYEGVNGRLPSVGTTTYKTVTETVNNSFPIGCVNNGATQDVLGNQKEIWPQVLENAYASLNGGYGVIGAGGSPIIAMQELTGHAASSMAPASLTLAALQGDVLAGDLIVMDTFGKSGLSNSLVEDHAYMFDGVTGTGTAATLKLLNPWGMDQPTPILLSQLSKNFAEVDVGHLA